MYTPTPNDSAELNATRDDIRAWIATLFGPEIQKVQFLQWLLSAIQLKINDSYLLFN